MNWKNRYMELKVGDTVKIVRGCTECRYRSHGCAHAHIGNIGMLMEISHSKGGEVAGLNENPYDQYDVMYKYNITGKEKRCSGFDRNCLEKVPK